MILGFRREVGENWVLLGCYTVLNFFYFHTRTAHLLLFCTMTNKYTIISQIITFLHVSTLTYHPQGACNQFLAKLHSCIWNTCVSLRGIDYKRPEDDR